MAKQPFIPPFGKEVKLSDYSTREAEPAGRDKGKKEIEELRLELEELHELIVADGRFPILVLLQAPDAGGKDGTIRSVFDEVDPLGVNSVGFKAPNDEELAHDYLWRIHRQMPGKGHVTIFNRSHYEDVLVVRVRNLAPKERWKKRYDHINNFERMLTDEGMVIIKFFLHISKDEQRERLQERIDNPKKQWKFRAGDLEDRALWEDYQAAYEEMLERCNTEYAPWHIIPADRNWYRDLMVGRIIRDRLNELGLRYPPPEPGVAGRTVV
ncbi:MAG: polyphosphate kinase 2 family protein [Dehalococcoidia bacterium]|nr:polyphosphate kinase 2 family protein [Dehalococcoidia bacterium]MCB9486643.1 polyphosphate kinase 2 family protein [Thermoflexaceae bacterium]